MTSELTPERRDQLRDLRLSAVGFSNARRRVLEERTKQGKANYSERYYRKDLLAKLTSDPSLLVECIDALLQEDYP